MENLTNAFQAQKTIFNIYEIKNNIINGKAHYTSEDGNYALVYKASCGAWFLRTNQQRYVAISIDL